jgi:hypothetical protein
MNFTIFYSWQSDSEAKYNRYFIERCINQAITNIKSSDDIKIDPVLDRDTLNQPGSIPIVDTILKKIDSCGIFLSDVTIINPLSSERKMANPNVLMELGYATAKLGHTRVINVMNTVYGDPQENSQILPFDIRHLRWPLRYSLNQYTQQVNEQRNLASQIEVAIRAIVDSGILRKNINPKDKLFASELRNSLVHISMFLGTALAQSHRDDFQKILVADFSTEIRDEDAISDISLFLKTFDWLAPSNMSYGNKPVSWFDNFLFCVKESRNYCERLLNIFSNRDDELFQAAYTVFRSLDDFDRMFPLLKSMPEFLSKWSQGIPSDQYVDFINHLLISIIRANRRIKNFV